MKNHRHAGLEARQNQAALATIGVQTTATPIGANRLANEANPE